MRMNTMGPCDFSTKEEPGGRGSDAGKGAGGWEESTLWGVTAHSEFSRMVK